MRIGGGPRRAAKVAALVVGLGLVAAACGDGDGATVASTAVEQAGSAIDEAREAADQVGSTDDAPDTGDSPDTAAGADPAVEDSTEGDDAEPRFELEGELPLNTVAVNDMLAFIEAETGREFRYAPTIVAQSRVDYEAGLAEQFGEGVEEFRAEAESAARLYQALGLSEQTPTELADNVEAFVTSADGVQGYYDPDTDALYVPVGAEADDLFRSVLVHELAHAHDGQHVDLAQVIQDIEDNPDDTERNFARTAVVEGRATAVQSAWMLANGVVPQPGAIPDAVTAVPPAFVNALTLPYGFGQAYVAANGGAAGTWEAFDNPPTTSEQILFPDTAATESVVDVPAPVADGPVLDESPWGAADIVVWLLSESLQPNQADLAATLLAADGWAGGRMVLWGDDAESCARLAVAADTPADLAEIEAAVDRWVAKAAGRTVEAGDELITVTACAPFRS